MSPAGPGSFAVTTYNYSQLYRCTTRYYSNLDIFASTYYNWYSWIAIYFYLLSRVRIFTQYCTDPGIISPASVSYNCHKIDVSAFDKKLATKVEMDCRLLSSLSPQSR